MNSSNSLISIIVPIYNVEKYLPDCIESILAQTYKNLEIILVDDGSPDSCGEICDAYAKRDSRIKVIHKENGGVSSARNAGLEAASGLNKQSSVIIAISNKTVRDKLSQKNASILSREGDPFYGAPVIIAVIAKKEGRTYVNDGSLSLGNMMLAAHSLGLGSCWIHRAKETFDAPEWRDFIKSLGLEGEYEGIGHLALGYIDGDYPAKKERLPDRAFFVE